MQNVCDIGHAVKRQRSETKIEFRTANRLLAGNYQRVVLVGSNDPIKRRICVSGTLRAASGDVSSSWFSKMVAKT